MNLLSKEADRAPNDPGYSFPVYGKDNIPAERGKSKLVILPLIYQTAP